VQGPGADKRRAPQDGETPLFKAARKGHFEVAQLLVQANADMHFKKKVTEGRGCWAHEGYFVFLAAGCSTAAGCHFAGEGWFIVCTGQWTGIALNDLSARSWAEASF